MKLGTQGKLEWVLAAGLVLAACGKSEPAKEKEGSASPPAKPAPAVKFDADACAAAKLATAKAWSTYADKLLPLRMRLSVRLEVEQEMLAGPDAASKPPAELDKAKAELAVLEQVVTTMNAAGDAAEAINSALQGKAVALAGLSADALAKARAHNAAQLPSIAAGYDAARATMQKAIDYAPDDADNRAKVEAKIKAFDADEAAAQADVAQTLDLAVAADKLAQQTTTACAGEP